MDNHPSHHDSVDSNKQLTVVEYSPTRTSVDQLMDQGVIKALKDYYKSYFP